MRSSVAGAALLLLAIVVAALSVGSVRLDSATSDEPAYIAAGMIKLGHGRLDFFRDQPPLMNSISAAPLLVAGYRLPPFWTPTSNHWVVGRRFLYRSGLDGHRMLLLARLPTIALFVALIGTVYWFVRRETGRPAWALAAATLAGLCPNLMAHGRLATVDLALSFFTFAAAALFIRVIEEPSIPAAILTGIASAGAVLSKTSGNIIGPYFVIVLAVALVFGRGLPASGTATDRDLPPSRWRKAVILCFVIAIISAVGFAELFINFEASGEYVRASFPALATSPLGRIALPFAEYAANIRAIREWYTLGHDHPQFLLGQFSYTGWPQYYPIAFLLKTTIPAVLLFIAGAVVAVRRIPKIRTSRADFASFACLVFVLLFLVVAARGHLDLGIRYVLPVYPFLYAATAIALAQTSTEVQPKWRKTFAATIFGLVAWHAVENFAAYPSYLSYFNELSGNGRNADRFLVDSNLDWGQDLRRLDLWCRDSRIPEIAVHYFGGGDPDFDMRYTRPVIRYAPGPGPLPKGWFALSRHFYRLSFMPGLWPIDYDTYLAASHAKYVTTVGGSIYVYRVD